VGSNPTTGIMKFMVCGSMYFSKEMLETQKKLEEMGHEVLIADDVMDCLDKPELSADWEHCINLDIDKKCFDKVAESDAIIVLNYPRKEIPGYVGGATLMEIGLARHLNKRIFLLHSPPSEEHLRYAFEVKLTKPVVLDGDLNNIKKHV